MIKRHHSLIVILHRGFITTQIGVLFLALRGGDSTISSALQQSKREWPFPYIALALKTEFVPDNEYRRKIGIDISLV